jgi:glycosyltransferase involved in cell wall biosynthesis
MNKALALASGELVLILNADDWYVPECVKALVDARAYAGTDIVSALADYVDGDGKVVQRMRSMPFDAATRLRMPLRHETMLVPAQLYDRHGAYDTSFSVIADLDFTLRLYEAGVTHYEIPRALLNFRNTGVSSVAKTRLFAERRRLLARQFPSLSEEELGQLEHLAKLQPQQLGDMARRHAQHTPFIQALVCYVANQRRRSDAKAWREPILDWARLWMRDDRPLVTVVLAVFDAQETIAAAIESVLAQSMTSLELLCVNDCSPDGSQLIIDRYAVQDRRVRSLLNERNIGLGASRNRGIRAARGAYIFHLDPDDTIPPTALATLTAVATANGSQMVKGAYLRDQLIHGKGTGRVERKSLLQEGGQAIVNTALSGMPALLATTEGHWSYLYEAAFARRIPYPIDLKMGQDSIFLVRALAEASEVSVIDDVVYRYGINPRSAMNTFNERKFLDAVRWRARAWHMLVDHGFRQIADRLLSAYWGDAFFTALIEQASREQLSTLLSVLQAALREAGIREPSAAASPTVRRAIGAAAEGSLEEFIAAIKSEAAAAGASFPPTATSAGAATPATTRMAVTMDALPIPVAAEVPHGRQPDGLRVATFCSMDTGGAGTGSQRRIEALRSRGHDVTLNSLVVRTKHGHVKRVASTLPAAKQTDPVHTWKAVQDRAIHPVKQLPGFRATELFSLPESLVDFRELKPTFDAADVLHFHWVVGMFDYERAGEVLADKPTAWTLADMNAFTGGCHYSEGCDGYKRECRACPLLGGESDLAWQTWKRKKAAYEGMKRLHIICPSKWMAQRVAESSLLGDKPIHYVPNAFPTARFTPTNKVVARIRLGLPLDRKLLLFGADSVGNKRKGGDHLRLALDRLKATGADRGVELITFGHHSIQLPIPSRSMGHVSDDERLALIYSAADAFVFPSLEDNAPLTVGESLLCGTPVVGFPVGNVPDLLRHRDTGYLAKYLDAEDLVNGIRWAIEVDPQEALRRSLRCRTSAAAIHDPVTAAARHESIYKEIIGNVESP